MILPGPGCVPPSGGPPRGLRGASGGPPRCGVPSFSLWFFACFPSVAPQSVLPLICVAPQSVLTEKWGWTNAFRVQICSCFLFLSRFAKLSPVQIFNEKNHFGCKMTIRGPKIRTPEAIGIEILRRIRFCAIENHTIWLLTKAKKKWKKKKHTRFAKVAPPLSGSTKKIVLAIKWPSVGRKSKSRELSVSKFRGESESVL